MRILTSAVLALSFAASTTLARKYPTSGLYNVDTNVKLGDVQGTVAAFGDFNGDKYTDIITLSDDQTSFSIYLWDHPSWSFSILPAATIRIDQSPQNFIITNIVPGDFNHDGRLDLLVMGQVDPVRNPNGELMMRIYLGNIDNGWDAEFITLPSSTSQQPMTFDVNGDMRTDLLGYAFAGYQAGTSPLSVWKNIHDPKNPGGPIFELVPMNFTGEAGPQCILSNPHSSAFVDLNGDCLADIFLTCQDPATHQLSYVIYTNNKDAGFEFAVAGLLPAGAGQVTFADMDGDGAVDMIVPACDNHGACSIYIYYNLQMPLCNSKDDKNCRKVTNLCVADPNFTFSRDPDHNTNPGALVRFPLEDVLPDGQQLLLTDPGFKGILPVSVHVGDYNLDGYPDLLVVSGTAGNNDRPSSATLLQSVLCRSDNGCVPSEVDAKRRSFVKVTEGANELNNLQDVRAAAFLDLDEDGTVDIMLLRNSNTRQALAGRSITMIHNNYFNDAFFLKTLASNGVCPTWCGAYDTKPSKAGAKPFGVNYPGATFKFTILDTSGKKRANQVAQYPSSTYLGLNVPYSLFGLGRTNNYVEELFVGVTRNQPEHFTTYAGVIPNSQLIIIPYQQEDDQSRPTNPPPESPPASGSNSSTEGGEATTNEDKNKGGPNEWTLELYVRPGDYVPWVFVTLATAIALLSGVVVGLNWMEKPPTDWRSRLRAHKWLLLLVVSFAQLLEIVNISSSTVVLPAILADVKYEPNQLQWVMSAYTLAFAGCLVMAGRLGDILGHRLLFLVGLTWFSLWSLIIGWTNSPVFMSISRALQGIGAGLTIPSALATLTTTFPPGPKRNQALAVFGSCGASGMVVGTLVGGALGDTIGWRWVFRLSAILGAVLAAIGFLVIPDIQHNARNPDGSRRGVDAGGLICFMGGIIMIVYYLSDAPARGWAAAQTLAPFIVGIVLLVAFIVIEFKVADPAIPPRIWRSRRFSSSVLGAVCVSSATNLMVYFTTLYLQNVLGYTTMQNGLAFLVCGVGSIPMNVATAKVLPLTRTKYLLIVGWIFLLVSAVLFAQMDEKNSYWKGPFPAYVVNVFGTAPVYLANQVNAVMYAPNQDQGVVSGIYNSAIQLGGPIGIAIATAISTKYAPVNVVNDKAALLKGYQSAFYTMAGFCGLGLIITIVFNPNRDPSHQPQEEVEQETVLEKGNEKIEAPVEEPTVAVSDETDTIAELSDGHKKGR
ncbi:hypothetical protein BGZ83_011984 [Gryganskiella cystojenkinii]|nr:hypothetical protein BGZ83_011984 [Gryganskiella cystojenkinii]